MHGNEQSSVQVHTSKPPGVQAAGHDRCIIALKPEHIDAWLNPESKSLSVMYAIWDDPTDVYYAHEVVGQEKDAEKGEE